MTQKVHPSFGRTARSREIAAAIQYGGATDGWVVPNSTRLVEDSEGDLASGPLDAFAETHSDTSLEVTIASGEALVEGAYLAVDSESTVTLAADTAGQTVSVGWKDGQSDEVTVGLDSGFSSADHSVSLWQMDTDSSGVVDVSDVRVQSAHSDTKDAHHPPVSVSGPLTESGDQQLGLSVGDGLTTSGGSLGADLGNGLEIDVSGQIHVPTGAVKANELGESVDVPTYSTLSEVPELSEGHIVYVSDENGLFVEDGT